jgi:hypothetical protein
VKATLAKAKATPASMTKLMIFTLQTGYQKSHFALKGTNLYQESWKAAGHAFYS